MTALIVWGEVVGWRSEMHRVEEGTSKLAQSFVQHAEDTFEVAKTPLVAMVAQLENVGTEAERLVQLKELMLRLKAETPRVQDLFVYGERGDWIVSTATSTPASANNADRDYFKRHASSSSKTVSIGNPVQSRTSGEWIIPVTMRYNHKDGGFAGVVLASVAVRYLSDYYDGFLTGQLETALLVRGDGVVLARAPFDVDVLGQDLSNHDLFANQLSRTDSGYYHYVSPVDLVERVGGFHRSWRSQLVVLSAVAQSEATATWIRGARWRWAAVAVVICVSILLLWLLHRRTQAKRRSDEALASREAELRLLTENANDLVERLDPSGIRRYVSPSARSILGASPEDLLGTNAFDSIVAEDKEFVLAAVRGLYQGDRTATVAFRLITADQTLKWVESTLSVLPRSEEGETRGVVSVTRDISERKILEQKLQELAALDGLTGLANRRSFDVRIELEMARSRRDRRPLSLLLVDVDNFKLFNDTYGHLAGDNCLKEVAAVLARCARRPGDFVARYGGEEFVVLLPETDAAGAMTVAEDIRSEIEALEIPHASNFPPGVVTASLGQATAQDEWLSIAELVGAADSALYAAKERGRNQVCGELAISSSSPVH